MGKLLNMKVNGSGKSEQQHLLPLSERNAEAAAIAIQHLEQKVYEALQVVGLQQKTLSMLVEKVGILEQLVNVQKMQMTGLGPSVKG